MYDPSTARFLSKDPLEDAGGSPDLYLYCANDPVNRTDPSGHELIVVGKGALSDVLWRIKHNLGRTGPGYDPVVHFLPDDAAKVGDLPAFPAVEGVTPNISSFLGRSGGTSTANSPEATERARGRTWPSGWLRTATRTPPRSSGRSATRRWIA